MAAPLVSRLCYGGCPVRSLFMDRGWWLFADDVARCLGCGPQLFWAVPGEARCELRFPGQGTTVRLITTIGLIRHLEHRGGISLSFVDWLRGFAHCAADARSQGAA